MSKNIDHPIALDLVEDLQAGGCTVAFFKNNQRLGTLQRLQSIPKRPVGMSATDAREPSDFYSISFTGSGFSYIASDIFIRSVIENATIKPLQEGVMGFYIEERF